MSVTNQPVGGLLREWRQRRRLSQLDLACEAEVSQRHLSFIESGRAAPSREMLLHLAGYLEVPLRERNILLLAGGFAPVFQERQLDDPELRPAKQTMELVLKGHEPFPALAVDRHWTLVAANRAVAPLLSGIAEPKLLTPPVNVLRLSLHPGGLAPRIANLAAWRGHILERLRQQIATNRDRELIRLLAELTGYKTETPASGHLPDGGLAGVAVPLELDTMVGRLSLISTTMVFGTAMDVTLAELAIEAFFPANAETLERLHRITASAA